MLFLTRLRSAGGVQLNRTSSGIISALNRTVVYICIYICVRYLGVSFLTRCYSFSNSESYVAHKTCTTSLTLLEIANIVQCNLRLTNTIF